jgi:glucose/arabinose dehydrogenase
MFDSVMRMLSATSMIMLLILLPIQPNYHNSLYGDASGVSRSPAAMPTINDPSLKVDTIFRGLNFPTSMAFLAPNDILVLEKNNGTVQRIVNGRIQAEPLINVGVANKGERGMLGIAIANNSTRHTTYVFVYYTQSGDGITGDDVIAGIQPSGNRLYRYELANNKLVNPKLLLTIPTSPKTPNHNGGKIIIGPDQNIYLVVGDADKFYNQYFDHMPLATRAQNINNDKNPDGAGGILRLTQDGTPVLNGIFANNDYPLNLYYAYGIRNSFGLAFDPLTGTLWDTENGPDYGDEINLVQPGFNSGWGKVQGIWYNNGSRQGPAIQDLSDLNKNNILVNLSGKGKYRTPEFIWNETIAPTGLAFLNSTKMGQQYENDMFVGDFKNGNLYHFKLNNGRTGLSLHGSIADRLAFSPKDIQDRIFARGFGAITDVKTAPDGSLYIVSNQSGTGTIYRISHK